MCRSKHQFHRANLNLGDVDIPGTPNLLAYLMYARISIRYDGTPEEIVNDHPHTYIDLHRRDKSPQR
jgi:hypothetical protein